MNELQAEYRPKATRDPASSLQARIGTVNCHRHVGRSQARPSADSGLHRPNRSVPVRLDGLKKVNGKSLFGSFSYEPVMFHKEFTKEKQKLLLACGAHVFGQVQGKLPETGLLMFGASFRTTTVRPTSYSNKLQSLLQPLAMSEAAPSVLAQRPLQACEFRERCHQQAVSDDHLSLLRRMTETQAKNTRKKGIFTVYQLSHTFRPRRRSEKGIDIWAIRIHSLFGPRNSGEKNPRGWRV